MSYKKLNFTVNRTQLRRGLLMLLLGIAMPLILQEHHFGIYDLLSRAARHHDFGSMMKAVVLLIAMNCIRTTPNYLGAFIICESIKIRLKNRELVVIKGLFIFFILKVSHFIIGMTSGIQYDLGAPAILIICCMTALMKMGLLAVNTIKKAIIIGLLIIDMQCLTIFPPLADFGFGLGAIFYDVKMYAKALDMENALSFLMLLLMIIFFTTTALVIKLVNDEDKFKKSIAKQQETEKQLSEELYNTLMLRNLQESQNIVHDLKSPLTTIQGLSSLTQMMSSNKRILEYQARISSIVDRMNEIISEILHEGQISIISVSEIINQVSDHVSANEALGRFVHYQIDCPDSFLLANRIRLMRAIINVIENAAVAALKSKGPERARVRVVVSKKDNIISISVTDNGRGIKPENLKRIWKPGFSTNKSTGLGLSFVEHVVENHRGTISIDSIVDRYTTVALCFNEVKP